MENRAVRGQTSFSNPLTSIRWKYTIIRAFLWSLIILWLLLTLTPALWMVFSSFKTLAEIRAVPISFFPQTLILDNYIKVIEYINFPRVLMNSVIITVGITLANILTCTWGGYVFGKLRWRARETVFLVLLGASMIPDFLILIPRYIITVKLGLLNTYAGAIIPFITGIFGIFLAKQFMLTIPDELIDAAVVDGCSSWDVYWKIILPLCKPLIAILVIFMFQWSWDNLIWPSIILTDKSMYTLALAIAYLRTGLEHLYNQQMAGSTLAIIPVLIVFLIFQKHITEGAHLSGLKM